MSAFHSALSEVRVVCKIIMERGEGVAGADSECRFPDSDRRRVCP